MAEDRRAPGAEAPAEPRRRPRQARSRAIVDAICEASERILVSEGPEGLNTNRIAEVAGVNVASVYRYFPNKEAVVAALYERRLEAYAESLDGLYARSDEIDAYSLEEAMRFMVRVVAELHGRLLALHAEFYRRHEHRFDLTSRPSPRGERRWADQATVWLRTVLERHSSRLRVDDLERASFLVAHSVLSVFRSAVRDAPHLLDDEDFEEDVVAMVLGLLLRR